jgi:glucan phosphoethanolaminetransferase (alkaline phosphatase superfamily)
MPRNIEGLKRSARLRSETVMQRALAALQRMDASDREINFRTVATQAGVSTAWLYSQEELRGRIMRSRRATIDVPLQRRPHGIESARLGRT